MVLFNSNHFLLQSDTLELCHAYEHLEFVSSKYPPGYSILFSHDQFCSQPNFVRRVSSSYRQGFLKAFGLTRNQIVPMEKLETDRSVT